MDGKGLQMTISGTTGAAPVKAVPALSPSVAPKTKAAPAPKKGMVWSPRSYTIPPSLAKLAAKPSGFASPENALLVKLAARPEAAALESMPRGAARKAAAWQALTDTAAASQRPFIELAEKLKSSGAIAGYEALVSPNMLIVTPKAGKTSDVLNAFSIDGVSAIYNNSGGDQVFPKPTGAPAVPSRPAKPSIMGPRSAPTWGYEVVNEFDVEDPKGQAPVGLTYGVELLGMPEAWKQGATGAGLVYGMIDSGVQWNHPALREAYRGSTAQGANHDYNWMDFEGSSPSPVDGRGHGTHVMGSVVGRTSKAQFGVAPEAKFIVSRGTGTGRIDSALRALQWMQAPTKRDGSAADATKAPDVVGMSWFMANPTEELFRDSIQNLRLAGIEVVKSAGNQGPGPSTITSPGHFPEIYAVAAVDKDGKVADFSSRGNARIPAGSPTLKPDFAAPGVNIISSIPGDGYGAKDGTSMAQPHFSAAVLAVLSKFPQLTHDQLTQVLAAGAIDPGTAGRDPEYGQGIINVPRSLEAAAQLLSGSEITVKPIRREDPAGAAMPTPAAPVATMPRRSIFGPATGPLGHIFLTAPKGQRRSA